MIKRKTISWVDVEDSNENRRNENEILPPFRFPTTKSPSFKAPRPSSNSISPITIQRRVATFLARNQAPKALLVSDFGPRITIKNVERLRGDIRSGKLKSGSEIKDALKGSVLEMLAKKNSKTKLQLGYRKPAVIVTVGVNGGGKTTSLGKLANRLKNEGSKVIHLEQWQLASDQLEIWAERTGCEIVVAEGEKAKAATVLSKAVKEGRRKATMLYCATHLDENTTWYQRYHIESSKHNAFGSQHYKLLVINDGDMYMWRESLTSILRPHLVLFHQMVNTPDKLKLKRKD